MTQVDFQTYIDNHHNKKGEDITHTRIGDKIKIKGGSYNITDEAEFLESYYEHVIQNGQAEYLTEKQLTGDDKRLVVDIDLRYSEEVTTRLHKPDHITDLIYLYLCEISSLCMLSNKYTIQVFVMEKPNVNILETKTKDGIHLIFGVCLNADIQNTLRHNVMPKLEKLWDDLPLVNTIDEVIDHGIVKGNVNWQLYGSKKPNHEAYRLVDTYNCVWDEDTHEWAHNLINFDIKKNFDKLSIRCKNIQKGVLKDGAKIIAIPITKKIINTEVEEPEEPEEQKTFTQFDIQAMIDGLPEEAYRCGGGNYCLNMVFALKKAGATRTMVKKLCQKAGSEYDNEWFKAVWKQDSTKYPYDINFIKSKTSWRSVPAGCVIDTDELIINSGNVLKNTEYIKIKTDFELDNFFLKDLVVWVCNEKDNDNIKKFLLYSKQQLLDKYAHITFLHKNKYETEEKKFVATWLTDQLRKSYNYTNVFPSDIVCPENVYNLWTGFGVEQIIIPEKYDKKGKTDNIKQLIKILCEKNDELYDYFMKYLAHIFQYPSTKEKVSFLFTGEMGIGKSTLKILLHNLLGNNLYTEPDNADKLFQRFKLINNYCRIKNF